MKLLISKHALNRFKERFRLHYNRSWFINDRVPELIQTLFSKSHKVLELDACPFYKNKLHTEYSEQITMFRVDDVVFVCVAVNSGWFLKTCMPVKFCKPWLTYQ